MKKGFNLIKAKVEQEEAQKEPSLGIGKAKKKSISYYMQRELDYFKDEEMAGRLSGEDYAKKAFIEMVTAEREDPNKYASVLHAILEGKDERVRNEGKHFMRQAFNIGDLPTSYKHMRNYLEKSTFILNSVKATTLDSKFSNSAFESSFDQPYPELEDDGVVFGQPIDRNHPNHNIRGHHLARRYKKHALENTTEGIESGMGSNSTILLNPEASDRVESTKKWVPIGQQRLYPSEHSAWLNSSGSHKPVGVDRSNTSMDKHYKEDTVVSPSDKDWRWLPMLMSRSKSSPTISKPRMFIDPRVLKQKQRHQNLNGSRKHISVDNLLSMSQPSNTSPPKDKFRTLGAPKFVLDRVKVVGDSINPPSEGTVEGFAQNSFVKLKKPKSRFPALKEEHSIAKLRPEGGWQWKLDQATNSSVFQVPGLNSNPEVKATRNSSEKLRQIRLEPSLNVRGYNKAGGS